jgi:hypothetical protein
VSDPLDLDWNQIGHGLNAPKIRKSMQLRWFGTSIACHSMKPLEKLLRFWARSPYYLPAPIQQKQEEIL